MSKKNRRTKQKLRTGKSSSFQTIERDEENPDHVEVKEYLVRFNVKFVTATMILLVVCGTGMHFFHGFQINRKADHYLDLAAKAEEEQDWKSAKRYLGSYYSLRRDDMEVLERLCLMQLDHPSSPRELHSAYLNLSKVVRQIPDKHNSRWKTALLGMQLGEHQAAIKHFEYLERHIEDLPGEISLAEIHQLRGDANRFLQKGSQAIKCYTTALGLDPSDIDAHLGLVVLLLDEDMQYDDFAKELTKIDPLEQKQAEKVEVADRLIDKMVKFGKPFDEALLSRFQYSLSLRPTETSEKVIPSPSTASQSAEQLLAIYDLDKNNKLDNADIDSKNPSIAWFNTNRVPSSADSNRDGTLEIQELEQWYREGERISRLKIALDDLKKILEKDNKHARANRYAAQLEISLAREYASLGNEQVAKNHVKEGKEFASVGLSQDPPDLNSFLSLSDLESLGRFFDIENAETYLEKSINHLRAGIQVATTLSSSTETEVSHEELIAVTENRSNSLSVREIGKLNRELHWHLADRLLSSISLRQNAEKNRQSIDKEIQEQILWLEQQNRRDFLLDFLQGQTLILDRKWNEALVRFLNISDRDAKSGGLKRRLVSYIASCYERLENPDESRRVLTQQIEVDPGWVGGRRKLAASLNDSGDYSKSIEHYMRISSIPGIPLAIAKARYREQIGLAVEDRKWNLVSAALDAEDKMHENKQDQELIDVLLVRASSLFAQAEEPIVRKSDGSKTGTMTKEYYFQAVDLLTTGIETNPLKTELRYGLIVLNLEHPEKSPAQRLELARKILSEARNNCGESLDLFRAEALILRHENPPQIATKLADMITNQVVQKFDRNERVQFANSLLREVNRLERDPDSEEIDNARKKILLHLASLLPNAMYPQMRLVELAIGQEDDDLFRHHIVELGRIEGDDGPNVLFAEAYHDLIAIQKNLDDPTSQTRKFSEPELKELSQIKEKLRKITRLRTQWAEPHRLQGNIDFVLGNTVNAIDSFTMAFERGSTNQSMVSRLVRLLMNEKRLEEANTKIVIHTNRLKAQTSPEISRLAWRVSWDREMTSEALGRIEKAVELHDDPRDKLFQARMAEVTESNRRKVEQLYKDAIEGSLEEESLEKAPEIAHRAYLAYVGYLKGIGSIDKAREQIEFAEKNLPQEPHWQKQLALAQCHERIEDFVKAENHYREAIKSDEQLPNLLSQIVGFYSRRNNYEKAEKYADQLLQLDADESVKRWTRARIAVLKATNLSYENVIEAQKELELNFNEEEKRMPGFLRAKAQILSRKISNAGRLEQITNLEKLNKVTRLNTTEAFRLALLYDLMGEDKKYEKTIKLLLESKFSKPAYNAHYASWLTVKNRFDEALTQLLKLEQLMPNSLVSIGTRIRFHFVKGEKALGTRAAQDFLDTFQKKQIDFKFDGSLDFEQLEQTMAELENNSALKDRASIVRLKKIRSLMEDSRTEAATSLLKKLVEQKQLQSWAANQTVRLLATQLRNFGEISEAKTLFEKYYDFKRDPEGRLFVARLLADDGKIDNALAMAASNEKSARIETLVSFYATMIHKVLSKEQSDEIENWLKVAYGKQPESIAILNTLAEIQVMKGDFAQAVSLYRKLLKIHPTYIGAINNLAWILSQNPRTASEANLIISAAIKRTGPSSELLDTRGLTYLAMDNPQKAIRDFQQAISEFPSPQYYFHLSLAHFRMNELQKSRDNLKTAKDRGFSPDSLMPSELKDFQEMQSRLSK